MAMSRPLNTDDLLRGLECPVCQEHFREPKILPCGHTLCLSPCLEQISDGKDKTRCPECRTEHVIPKGGIKDFPTNVTVVRIFDKSKSATKFCGCPICAEPEDLLVKCLHCNLEICEECRQNHTVKFRDQVLELLEALKEETSPESIASRSNQKERIESRVNECVEDAIKQVKKIGEEACSVINRRVDGLVQRIHKYGKEEFQTLLGLEEEIQQNLEEISTYCQETISFQKRKVSTPAKLVKIIEAIRPKEQFVLKTKNRPERMLRNINITSDFEPLQVAVNNLANVSISSRHSENKFSPEGEDNSEDNDNKVMSSSTPSTESILTRDLSLKLCIGTEGSAEKNLKGPWGVAVDPITRDIIITDSENHRIQVFDENGEPKLRFGSPGNGKEEFRDPCNIVVTEDRQLVISDSNNHRMKVYTTEGNFVCTFGENGKGLGQFDYPYGVAVDKDGYIHVCDSHNKRIQVFNTTGQYKYMYNTWKNVCDENPYYICIHVCGNIGVIIGCTCIAVLNKQTQLLHTFSYEGTKSAISWADNELLITADFTNSKIEVFTTKGELVREFGEKGHHVGQLQGPRGLAVDDKGFIYVSCFFNHMVQKF